jgi:hypothetical protein
MIITVDHRPSGRGGRTDTKPWAVTSFNGKQAETDQFNDRDTAMERAAALAGVKL